jgi:hypothetical protein
MRDDVQKIEEGNRFDLAIRKSEENYVKWKVSESEWIPKYGFIAYVDPETMTVGCFLNEYEEKMGSVVVAESRELPLVLLVLKRKRGKYGAFNIVPRGQITKVRVGMWLKQCNNAAMRSLIASYSRSKMHDKIIDILEAGYDFDKRDTYGRTQLHDAVIERDMDLVKILMDHGADPRLKDRNGFSPLSLAYGMGDEELVSILKKSKAESGGASGK